jgi:adenylyltransferase/sulfurtransferase
MSLEEENTQLKQENKRLTQENEELKKRLAQLEPVETVETTPFQPVDKLTNEEIRRFGRQLVIPNFGIESKKRECD